MADTKVDGKPFMQIVEQDESVEAPKPKDVNVDISVQDSHDIMLDGRMRQALDKDGDAVSISVPNYTTHRKGHLKISHAIIDGEDYYYQIEPMRKSTLDGRSTIGMLVQAFATVVPDHIDVFIREPPKDLDWEIWTVVIKKGATLMGAKRFLEDKLVDKLLELDFWP